MFSFNLRIECWVLVFAMRDWFFGGMRLADVGNTPLVELEGLLNHGNRLFVKCEYMNPSGSHKDRTYLHMVTALEKSCAIKTGMTLIDCSTGMVVLHLLGLVGRKVIKLRFLCPKE